MARALAAFGRLLADAVAAGLLTALFIFFVIQIVSRYVFNYPLGWTIEACTMAWLWLVFWGAGLIVPNNQQVRFDIISAAASLRTRRRAALVGGVFIVATFVWSLPASFDFVSFMKIERSGTLGIPLNLVFSVFILFSIGVILRQCIYLWRLLRGADPDSLDPTGIEAEIREI